MSHIWEDVLSERDWTVLEKGGYGRSRGLGSKPCVMIIDAQYNYVGEDKPLLEQQGLWPAGCGEEAWKGVKKTKRLVDIARAKKVPLVYTRQIQQKP